MKKPEACENINDIREAIDSIDREIIELIAKRSKYVYKAAEFKTSSETVKAEDRVLKMLSIRRQWARENNLSEDFIENLYKQIVNYFINEEMIKWKSSNK
jgi:isochorismate pyruvate lyase